MSTHHFPPTQEDITFGHCSVVVIMTTEMASLSDELLLLAGSGMGYRTVGPAPCDTGGWREYKLRPLSAVMEKTVMLICRSKEQFIAE